MTILKGMGFDVEIENEIESKNKLRSQSHKVSPDQLSNIKILVIDDSKSFVAIIINILKRCGFKNIRSAFGGKEALAKLVQEPDTQLILSDLNMPIVNGIELLKSVKENDSIKNIPFIMLTSSHSRNDVLEVISLGAADYITKPVDEKIIKMKLEKLFLE